MTGLILKDCYVFKKIGKQYLFSACVLAAYGFFMQNAYFVQAMVTFLIANVTISSMTFDEAAKWDKYVLTMPIEKKNIVTAKFLFLLFSLVISTVLGIAVGVVTELITKNGTAEFNLEAFMTVALVGVVIGAIAAILISLTTTIVFKIGAEKSRVISMIIYLIPFLLILLISQIGEKFISLEKVIEILDRIQVFLPFIGIAIVVLAVGACYCASVRIYKKKEF